MPLLILPFLESSPREFIFRLILITILLSASFIDWQRREIPHVLSYSIFILQAIYISFYPNIFNDMTVIELVANFGLSFFAIDFFTHLMNKLLFRKNAEAVSPLALNLGIKFLDQNINLVYLGISSLLLFSYYTHFFAILNLVLGMNYLIMELWQLSRNHKENPPEIHDHKSCLGGGDATLLAVLGGLLGLVESLKIFVYANYIMLALWLIWSLVAKITKNNKMNDFMKQIPLGLGIGIATWLTWTLK